VTVSVTYGFLVHNVSKGPRLPVLAEGQGAKPCGLLLALEGSALSAQGFSLALLLCQRANEETFLQTLMRDLGQMPQPNYCTEKLKS